jgi:hypothetical protein
LAQARSSSPIQASMSQGARSRHGEIPRDKRQRHRIRLFGVPETVAVTAADDTRSLTYAELGKARGISTASAKRLAPRHGWHKEPGNDGLARVRVPATWLETPPATDGARRPGDTSPATVPVATLARVQQDAENAIRATEARAEQEAQAAAELRVQAARLEGELAGLQEAMRRADAAAQRAEEGRREAEAARDVARGESATSREQVTAERERAEVAQRALQAAEAELVAWWTSGGALKRAWRGFLGRRGQ